MLTKFMFLLLLLASTALSRLSQSEEDQKLIIDVIQQTTVIQAYVDLCRERAPATDADNQQAYADWKERNQWEAIRSWLATNVRFQEMSEQARQSALRMATSKSTDIASTCRNLPRVIMSPQFDPSVRHGAELKRIADQLRSNLAAQASPPAVGSEARPMKPSVASSAPAAQAVPKRSNQVEGIVIHQISLPGYRGMIVYHWVPHVLFKDGTIYKDLNASPYDLDVKRSREAEPEKWGRWRYVGKQIHIQWNGSDKTEEWGESQWQATTPAKKTDRLDGSYSSQITSGNGSVAGRSISGFTFTADGRFSTGNSTSVLAGIYSRSSQSKSLGGTYALDGYSIELRFDDGRVERKGFYFNTETWIGIGNNNYLK
jgi:hypothetical protein